MLEVGYQGTFSLDSMVPEGSGLLPNSLWWPCREDDRASHFMWARKGVSCYFLGYPDSCPSNYLSWGHIDKLSILWHARAGRRGAFLGLAAVMAGSQGEERRGPLAASNKWLLGKENPIFLSRHPEVTTVTGGISFIHPPKTISPVEKWAWDPKK